MSSQNWDLYGGWGRFGFFLESLLDYILDHIDDVLGGRIRVLFVDPSNLEKELPDSFFKGKVSWPIQPPRIYHLCSKC